MQFWQGLVQRCIVRTRLPTPENINPLLRGAVQDHLSTLNVTMKLLPNLMKYDPLVERSANNMAHRSTYG